MSTRDAASKSFLSSDVINDEFFIDIVQSKLNIAREEFKLRLVFMTPATGKGDNYASVVYRAQISIEILKTKEKKFVDVIIKALIMTFEQLSNLEIFKREIVMYKDVLGSSEKILLEIADEKIEFGPKCIKIVFEPYEIIVLDDLKEEGYVMADRKVGLDLEHSKLVLNKLAKFHAASAVRYQKEGRINEQLDRFTMMNDEKVVSPEQFQKTTDSFVALHRHFIQTLRNMEGLAKIADKIERWDMTKMMMLFMAMVEPMQCGLQVLNHGDNWVNNMMFKYDSDDRVLDVKFIDFQLSFWGSPSSDLMYFLVSSVQDGVKIKHFDDLIQFYHEELVSSLKKLKYEKPIPTLNELQVDLLHKGGGFPFNSMLVMTIVKHDSDQEIDLEKIFDSSKGSGVFDEAYRNPIYRKALIEWMPFLDKRGYLDNFLPTAPYTPFMQAIIDQMPKPPEQVKVEE